MTNLEKLLTERHSIKVPSQLQEAILQKILLRKIKRSNLKLITIDLGIAGLSLYFAIAGFGVLAWIQFGVMLLLALVWVRETYKICKSDPLEKL